jgi:hypothetical protein
MPTKKLDMGAWYWSGFYRRGIVSLVMRTIRMRKVPMPFIYRAWPRAAMAQVLIPLSMDFTIALATIIHVERQKLAELAKDCDPELLKELAPAGSLSPMSCDAAVRELATICEMVAISKERFRQEVTWPFIRSSVYEFALLLLLAVFALMPTWFVYALTTGSTTYSSAALCAGFCYLFALPQALKLFKYTTLIQGEQPRIP